MKRLIYAIVLLCLTPIGESAVAQYRGDEPSIEIRPDGVRVRPRYPAEVYGRPRCRTVRYTNDDGVRVRRTVCDKRH